MNKFDEIVNADVPVLVDFFATWCGPCQMLHPRLEELHEKLGDKLKIIKIDIDKNQALASSLKIQSVPTLMLFKNGELKWRESGLLSTCDLEELIQKHL